MNRVYSKPTTLDGLKKMATQIKRAEGCKHTDALERAAERCRFLDYAEAVELLPLGRRGERLLDKEVAREMRRYEAQSLCDVPTSENMDGGAQSSFGHNEGGEGNERRRA